MRAALEAVLNSGWTYDLWREFALPYLQKVVTPAHKSLLLSKLNQYPWVADFMISKGWQAELIPALKLQLTDGTQLYKEALMLLAATKDPSLAAGFRSYLINKPPYDNAFMQAMETYPGIDWPALVVEAWQQNQIRCVRKNADDPPYNSWSFKAAALGHREAFREVIRGWSFRSPSKEEIQQLVATETWDGEASDFLSWARANFDQLHWDQEIKRWSKS